MKRLIVSVLATATTFAGAQTGGMKGMDMKDHDTHKSQAQTHRGTGTVKSVDAAKGTLTLEHGPIASMNWPAMTMTFKAKDKKMLEGVKPGQKVEFEFESKGKENIVTSVK